MPRIVSTPLISYWAVDKDSRQAVMEQIATLLEHLWNKTTLMICDFP
jgi:hypothetical protein